MNPTPTAAEALEAANEITLRVQAKRGDCESAVTRIDELAEVCADFIRFNEDALRYLPTPGASTAAERAEPVNEQGYTEAEWHSLQRDMARLKPGQREDRPFVPVEVRQSAAERAGIALPMIYGQPVALPASVHRALDPDQFNVWLVMNNNGVAIASSRWEAVVDWIAAALNAPAAAPVAGLFEGGSKKTFDAKTMRTDDRCNYWAWAYRGEPEWEPVKAEHLIHAETEIWCDRHGLPLPVPAPTAGGEGGE